jgi:hypothetical protein
MLVNAAVTEMLSLPRTLSPDAIPVFSAALQYNRNAVSAAEIRTAQGKEKDFNHFSL